MVLVLARARGAFGMNLGVHWVIWRQTKLATERRSLVYHVEALTRDAELRNRVEHFARQPGIQYSHAVDLYQSCLRALLPSAPQQEPKYRFCLKTSRRYSLSKQRLLRVSALPPAVRCVHVPHRLYHLWSIIRSQKYLIQTLPDPVPECSARSGSYNTNLWKEGW